MQQDRSQNSKFHGAVVYRNLIESDLAFVDELVKQAGWNQLREDWMRVISSEPLGCFAAFAENRLVGTVTTTTYGSELGWIGMMLVDANYRRRGIATQLMRRSIKYLNDNRIQCIKLDATPEGRFVYEQLGFVAEWSFHRWELVGERDPQTTLTAESQDPSAPLNFDLDLSAFGVARKRWLEHLARASSACVTESGFGLIRPGRIAVYLGPVVALTEEAARHIIQTLQARTVDRIFWDIPSPNAAAQIIASEMGFRPVRELTRMRLGNMRRSPELSLQFAIAGPECG